MDISKIKKTIHKFGQSIVIVAVLVCVVFAFVSTSQLNKSIDKGNRNIVLNYGNQVTARIHDLFEKIDISLVDLSSHIAVYEQAEQLQTILEDYESTWELDATGFLYEDGTICLSDGRQIEFQNEIYLTDVLSYSQKLNISRQTIDGDEMLVFSKPCEITLKGKQTAGIFSAMRLQRLERLLGDYGYSTDSFLVLTQADGENIWKQGDDNSDGMGNCFEELGMILVDKKDSVLQMETRMQVSMDGTISYTKDGQDYYMAYVPLNANYWYVLVSVRSDSIDLTELSRQHYVISALLMIGMFVLAVVSLLYLVQRNRSISQYDRQLKVAIEAEKEAMLAKQENKARQDFFAKVSHDIRTPLNGVVGMLTLAKEEITDTEKCTEYLDKAFVSAGYLIGLLNDVLDMSQIESGKQTLKDEIVDIQEILEEINAILETSTREKEISFAIEDTALQHRYFRGDKLRIKQILMNLCSNAIKYTAVGGRIRVEVGETQEEENHQLYFNVIDNGEGIAKDKLESIFDPFEQASLQRQGGVGLGLSIVRSFVELMGGRITVESQLGEGSTFRVMLPLQLGAEPVKELPEKKTVNLQDVSILLAEDSDINALIAVTLLEKRGAKVTHVKDGKAAVEEFERAPQGTYQIILMDIQMPVMNGLKATRLIRKLGRPDAATIPILSMTANAFHEQREEMIQAGMSDFLYKPIDIDEVCHCIEKWLV